MIKKHWLLKTDNQTITQTEKQGNIKFKLCKINHIRNPRSQKCKYIMKKTFQEVKFSIFILLNPELARIKSPCLQKTN